MVNRQKKKRMENDSIYMISSCLEMYFDLGILKILFGGTRIQVENLRKAVIIGMIERVPIHDMQIYGMEQKR